MNWIREVLSRMLRCEIATHEDVTLIWRVVRNIPARFTQLERLIMATKQDIQAQLAEADAASNNIADDVSRLKAKLDQALADNQGAIDSAVAGALQEVSDGLTPLVGRLQGVAASTPEDVDPEPAPPVEGDGGVDVDADGNPV